MTAMNTGGIRAIASFIPEATEDNLAQGARFGESEQFIREKIGALRLPRLGPGLDTSDLAVAATLNLCASSGLLPEQVDAIVVVTQNGDGAGLPHTSPIVHHKLGWPESIATFDLSLGCSGYVYGLAVLNGFLQATGRRNGVLITADPYSKIIDPADRVTTLLFGDAATATWVSLEQPLWKLGPLLTGTDGGGAQNIQVSDGTLSMNGRQVFNFAATRIVPQIHALLEQEQLKPEQIDWYCLHQGSAAIVNTIARKFPGLADRFVLDMQETGNTVSSSIPLLLEKKINDANSTRILLSGFGVGLSWATTILTREGAPGH